MKISIQQNENDCGLYIIKALYEHYHNHKMNINNLRAKTTILEKGISIYDLVSLAKVNYITLNPFHAKANEVLCNKNEYFIVGINNKGFNHYVIIEVKKDYVHVFDPAKGQYKLLFAEFINIYNNLIFTIKPKKVVIKKQIKPDIKIANFILSKTKIIFMSLVFIFISLILSFIATFFMKIIFDQIIPNQAFNLLTLISILFIVIAIIRVFTEYLKKLFIKKLALELEIILYKKYTNKIAIARLKTLQKFEKSDLLRRATLIETCSMFLSSSIYILIEESIMIFVSMSILIYINSKFFAIIFASSMLMILISILFHFLLSPLYQNIFKKAIKNFSYQNIRVHEIHSLKEKSYKAFSDDNLLSSFYNLKTQEYKLWKIISWKIILDGLISSSIPIFITYIFVRQIFTSNVSPGNMLLFLTIINFFNASLYSLTDYFLKLKQNFINWNYVKDVLNLQEEQNNSQGIKLNNIKSLHLSNIIFSYERPILNIKHFTFSNSIKVTSGNGTGKSTLLKLIALRFLPDFTYKINAIDYSFYNLTIIRQNIFYLEANNYLPASKIFAFITLNDIDLINVFEENLRKYKLDIFLIKNGIRLEHFFKEGGINLSSGQKQIICLMRLFTKKYELIVLDEAFENISEQNLQFFRKTICDFQGKAIFVEVSHTNRFLKNGKEINLEKINRVKI